MSALEKYVTLDVKAGSELDKALMGRVSEEQAAVGRIHLSDDYSVLPFGLTPQMQSWFLETVAPVRGQALSEIKGLFSADVFGEAGSRGHLHESELGQADQIRTNARRDVITQFYRGQETRIRERDGARRDYDTLRAREGGREPVAPSPWLYGLGLFVVLVIEMLLNFESLEKLPIIKSPFMASGAAMILALGLGFSAHVHGEILKQWHWYFGPQDRVRMWQGGRLLVLAELALSATLVFIGYARYEYILPKVQEALLLAQDPPSAVLSVLFMVSSNFIVFLVGVYWSYRNHDLNPEYPKKYHKWLKHRRLFEKAFLGLKAELGRLDSKHAEDVQSLGQFDSTQRSAPNYNRNREAVQAFLAADAGVRGALERYRTRLIKHLREAGKDPEFILPIVAEDGSTAITLTAEKYLAGETTLHLKVLTNVN
jgi:hypothetical protein